MFRTIKSKIIVISLLYTILVITLSFFSFFVISVYYLQENIPANHDLIYSIDNSETLLEIQDTNTFDSDDLINPKEIYTSNLKSIIKDIIIPIILINLIIVILSILLFNLIYNKKIKPLLNINNEDIYDFKDYHSELDSKNKIIKHNEEDIDKINNYIAHEMKNSLSILQSKILNNPSSVNDYIIKMSKQIDDINALTLSKINNITEVDFLLICGEVIDEFQEDIILNFNEDEEYQISANENLLHRVIYNIIENGYKYGSNKTVIDISKNKNNIICKITNNGDIINYNKIDKIFNYQYRVDNIQTNGYGIGLSLVKNIIELLNGSIYVESDEHITSFYISLPAQTN